MDERSVLTQRLVERFEVAQGRVDKVGWSWREAVRDSGLDGADPVKAAAEAIATAIDAEGPLHDRPPYHGRQHFCEVMLAASVLGRVHRLDPEATRLLLLAALVHDFGHDGGPSKDFRLERSSIARAEPYLRAAGVDTPTRERLATLVLATEPQTGVLAATRACRYHGRGHRDRKHIAPALDGPAELQRLAEDAALARLAALLCEADLLPSVGLTWAYAVRLQDRLASEWARPLGMADKLAFVDEVLAIGVIGPFFLPNVAAIRQELARRVHGPH